MHNLHLPTLRAEVLRSNHIPEGDLFVSIHFVRTLRIKEDSSRRFPHLNILQELHPKKAENRNANKISIHTHTKHLIHSRSNTRVEKYNIKIQET